MRKLNDTAKSISAKYIKVQAEGSTVTKSPVSRSVQSEINRIEAVITSLSNGHISQSEVVRLEAACIKLLGRVRSLSINTVY